MFGLKRAQLLFRVVLLAVAICTVPEVLCWVIDPVFAARSAIAAGRGDPWGHDLIGDSTQLPDGTWVFMTQCAGPNGTWDGIAEQYGGPRTQNSPMDVGNWFRSRQWDSEPPAVGDDIVLLQAHENGSALPARWRRVSTWGALIFRLPMIVVGLAVIAGWATGAARALRSPPRPTVLGEVWISALSASPMIGVTTLILAVTDVASPFLVVPLPVAAIGTSMLVTTAMVYAHRRARSRREAPEVATPPTPPPLRRWRAPLLEIGLGLLIAWAIAMRPWMIGREPAPAWSEKPRFSDARTTAATSNEGWLTRKLRGRPREARELMLDALECFRRQDYTSTVATCTSVLAIEPEWDFPYSLRADAYRNQGRHELEIADNEAAIRIRPSADNYIELAMAHNRLGNASAWVAGIESAIVADPSHGQAYMYRAGIRERLGDLQGALADVERAALVFRPPVDLSDQLARLRAKIAASGPTGQ